jgi:PAS domain S-box-containing protein
MQKKHEADFSALRDLAEKILQDRAGDILETGKIDLVHLFHELEIHQVELELQNEELRHLQQELEDSRNQYFDLYDGAPVGFVTVNTKGLIERVNRAAEEMLPDSGRIDGRAFASLLDSKDQPLYFSCLKKVVDTQSRNSCEVCLTGKRETSTFVRIEATAHYEAEKFTGFRLALSDISQQKAAEDALRESEERLRVVIEAGHLGSWDCVTGKVAWNPLLYALLGRNPNGPEVTGETFFDYIHPGDVERVRRHVKKTFESGTDFHDEFRVIRDDGKIRWLASSGHLYRNPSGQPIRMAGVNYDITEKKQMEETIQRSAARFRSFIELTGQYGWTTDAEGKVVEDLPLMRAFTGQSAEKDKGWGWLKALHPDDRQHTEMEWKRAVAERSKYETELRMRRYDGAYRNFLARGVPVFDSDGNVQEWVGTCIDITERKRAEEELIKLNETLEQRVAERTELAESRARQLQTLVSELTLAEQRERKRLAQILHDDLQQLLVAAKMNIEILSAQIGTQQQPAAERILNLIIQSIQTSRSLTAELSPPVLQQGSLSAALEWLCRCMQENHRLSVELKTDPGLDPQLEDITVFLFQCIRELLFNAVKHAGVKAARVEMSLDGKGRLRVAVSDEGAGFDPKTIWEKAQAGTGFGLFSIRERLALLGGSLAVESSPGNGATFSLIVPLETTRARDERRIGKIITQNQKPKVSGGALQILLVDDHTVVRQGLSTILKLQADVEVVGEAADGEEAVEKARRLQPDVILMDISLPKMDGLEATRIIHSEFPDIRIIGFSMHDNQDQAARMLAAGASAYCTKDGATDRLLSEIRGGGGINACNLT